MKNKLAWAALFTLISFNCFATTLHSAKIISEEIKMLGNAKGEVRDINGKQYDLMINRLQPPFAENGNGRIEISFYSSIHKPKGKNEEEIKVETDSDLSIYNRSSIKHTFDVYQFYSVGDRDSSFDIWTKVEIEANGHMYLMKTLSCLMYFIKAMTPLQLL